MSEAHWGRIIAAVAAIVIVLSVVWYQLAGNRKPAENTSRAALPAPARQQATVAGAGSTGNTSVATTGAAHVATTGAATVPTVATNAAGTGATSAVTTAPTTGAATAPTIAANAVTTVAATGATAAPASVETKASSRGNATSPNSVGTSTASESEAAVQKEAETYVRQLTRSSKEPLQVGHAEGFVKGSQVLSVSPPAAQEPGSGTRIAATGLAPAEEPSQENPAAAPASSESPQARALEAGQSVETKSSDLAPTEQPQPARASRVATAGESMPATAGSAAPSGSPALKSSETAAAAGAPAATSAETGVKSAQQVKVELPLNEQAPVTIAHLIGASTDVPADAVYYVHTVQPRDNQGIWGIVQWGVIENFAEGVAVRHGGHSRTYKVDIPRDADELRPDHSSSFLGELIYKKSRESYVYNFKTGRLGKNPNLIKPGQEIVIVRFTPEELIDIYKHFVYAARNRHERS